MASFTNFTNSRLSNEKIKEIISQENKNTKITNINSFIQELRGKESNRFKYNENKLKEAISRKISAMKKPNIADNNILSGAANLFGEKEYVQAINARQNMNLKSDLDFIKYANSIMENIQNQLKQKNKMVLQLPIQRLAEIERSITSNQQKNENIQKEILTIIQTVLALPEVMALNSFSLVKVKLNESGLRELNTKIAETKAAIINLSPTLKSTIESTLTSKTGNLASKNSIEELKTLIQSTLNAAQRSANEEKVSLKAQIEALRSEKEALISEKEALIKESNELKGNKGSVREKIQSLNQEITEKEGQISTINTQLKEFKEKEKALKSAIKGQMEGLSASNNSINMSNINKIGEKLQAYKNEIERLSAKSKNNNAKIAANAETIIAKNTKINENKTTIAQLTQAKRVVEEELDRVNDELTRVKQELQELKSKESSKINVSEVSNATPSEEEEKISKTEYNALEARRAELETEKNKLQIRFQELESIHERIKKELEEAKENIAAKAATIQGLENNKRTLKNSLSSVTQAKEAAESELETLKASTSDKNNEISQLKASVAALESRIKEKEDLLTARGSTNNEKTQTIKTQSAEITSLTQELVTKTSALETLQHEKESEIEELTEKVTRLSNIENALKTLLKKETNISEQNMQNLTTKVSKLTTIENALKSLLKKTNGNILEENIAKLVSKNNVKKQLNVSALAASLGINASNERTLNQIIENIKSKSAQLKENKKKEKEEVNRLSPIEQEIKKLLNIQGNRNRNVTIRNIKNLISQSKVKPTLKEILPLLKITNSTNNISDIITKIKEKSEKFPGLEKQISNLQEKLSKQKGFSASLPTNEQLPRKNTSMIPRYTSAVSSGISQLQSNPSTLNENLFSGGNPTNRPSKKSQTNPQQQQVQSKSAPQVQSKSAPNNSSSRQITLQQSETNSELELIELYYDFLKKIIETPNIVKISALTISELLNLFISNRGNSHEETIDFRNKKGDKISNMSVLKSLSSFLFINITEWVNDMFDSITLQNNNLNYQPKEKTVLKLLRNDYFQVNDINNLLNDTNKMEMLLMNIESCSNNSGQCAITNRRIGESNVKIYYINIFRYMEIIKNVISKDPDIDGFYKTTMKNATYNTIVNNFIGTNETNLSKSIENIVNTVNLISNTKNLEKKIDKLYLEKSTQNIISYLRIRCDPNETNQIAMYNRRFDIKLDETNKFINVGFNHHNFPYYSFTNRMQPNQVFLDSNLEQNLLELKDKDNKTIWNNYYEPNRSGKPSLSTPQAFVPKNYEHNYLLGPFNNIFPPKRSEREVTTNSDISDRMDDVVTLLLEYQKPVFIMGYGASGSGKTSSLVYFTKGETQEDRNGVLIALCNKMAKNKYDKLTVKAYEFYSDPYDTKNKKDIVTKVVPNELSKIENIPFIYDDIKKEFISQSDYTHINTFTDRTLDENGISEQDKLFRAGTSMGKVLIHIIDEDRYVKATPNNPNSSRSHAVIVIKFDSEDQSLKSQKSKPILIIGDFAGVENIFDCEDNDTILGFSDAHVDGIPTNPKFYSKYSKSVPKDGVVNSTSFACKSYSLPIYDIHKNYLQLKNNPSNLSALQNIRTPVNPDHANEISITEKIGLLLNPTLNVTIEQLFANKENKSKTLSDQTVYNSYYESLKFRGVNKDSWYKMFEYNLIDYIMNSNSKLNSSYTPEAMLNVFNTHKNNFLKYLKIFDYYNLMKQNSADRSTLDDLIDIVFDNQSEQIKNALNMDIIKTDYTTKYENAPKKPIPNFDTMLTRVSKQVDLSGIQPSSVGSNTSTQGAVKNALCDYNSNINNLIKYLNTGLNSDKPPNFNISNITFKKYSEAVSFGSSNKFVKGNSSILLNISNITYEGKVLTSDILINKIKDYYGFIQNNFVYKTITNSTVIEINTFSNIINSIKNKVEPNHIVSLFKYLYLATLENYIEYHCRYYKSTDICDIRKNEGIMINGTLEETRNIIKNMILRRNKDSIRVIPPFTNPCLPFYCVDGGCFKQGVEQKVNSVIFDTLQNEISEENIQKMVICIFMVLNVSPRANNPPPIPYIDIYKFNRFYYKIINKEKISLEKFNDTLDELYYLITAHFANKTKVLCNSRQFNDFKRIRNAVKDKLQTKNIKPIELNNFYSNITRNLLEFKELIDRNNAASALGTLEFLDLVSKYYTTNIMCKKTYIRNIENYKDLMRKYLNRINIRGGHKSKSSKSKSSKSKSSKSKSIKSKSSKSKISKSKISKSKSTKSKSTKSKTKSIKSKSKRKV